MEEKKQSVEHLVQQQLDECARLQAEQPPAEQGDETQVQCAELLERAQELADRAKQLWDDKGRKEEQAVLRLWAESVLSTASAVRDRWAAEEPFAPDPTTLLWVLSQLRSVYNHNCDPDSEPLVERVEQCTDVLGRNLVDALLFCGIQACYIYFHGLVQGKFTEALLSAQSMNLLQFALVSVLCMVRPSKEHTFSVQGEGGVQVARLLMDGVYSDSHLLALMYGGEMCFWGWRAWQDAGVEMTSPSVERAEFDGSVDQGGAEEDEALRAAFAETVCANEACTGWRVGVHNCARCRSVSYCSKECQTADWKTVHKLACVPTVGLNPVGFAIAWRHSAKRADTTRVSYLKTCGLRLLERYIRHVRVEPELKIGWSCDTAVSYAKQLKQAALPIPSNPATRSSSEASTPAMSERSC